MNLNKKQFSIDVAGRPLTFEVSRIAEQATSAVIGKYGETIVLVTVVMGKEDRDIDYLPLIVDYEEKFYAVGKILGSRFMRREGKSSDEAILSGRLIDRTIRPLFDHGVRREIQIINTILSIDGENDPDFVALMTTSVALAISEVPWNGPVAAVRVAKLKDGKYTVNPVASQLAEGFELETFVAGAENKISMIELEGREAQEADILQAFEVGQKEINKLIKFQKEIVEKIGKEKLDIVGFEPEPALTKKVGDFLEGKFKLTSSKDELSTLRHDLMEMLKEEETSDKDMALANHIFESTLDKLVHQSALEKSERQDGRKLDEVRELYAEVKLFERSHGSALFVRGGTQALAFTTLASPEGAQLIESMEFSGKKRFMLHYNFPPFSVGETGRMRGPGRRDIGHGALAEKAIRNMIPSKEEFPYAIRVVSEILASNGSSSMATVCATSLSLMDAGVPIKKPVAGIAMGLMLDDSPAGEGKYKVLTDIQGPEDHHGDMDFKVAGTKDGITAIQMDIKVSGVTAEIIKDALTEGKKARLHILEAMNKALETPREKISPYAPSILVSKINPDQIGLLIGPGGKTINGIVEETGAGGIDVDEDGTVYIYADKAEAAEAARRQVEALTKEYKIGEVVEGKIVKVLDFGAILEFAPGKDGMIHVSELKEGFVEKVEEVVKEGDFIRAKIVKIDNGKIGLSLKGMK